MQPMPQMLVDVAPITVMLKAFVICPRRKGTLVLLDRLDEGQPERYMVTPEPVAQSTYVQIYDAYDKLDDTVIGHVISYRKMQRVNIGQHYCHLYRGKQGNNKLLTEWTGEYLRLLEGEKGTLLHNACEPYNVASRRIDII